MSYIVETAFEYLAELGYLFAAEVRYPSVANNGTAFIQIEAGTKPVKLVFGAGVEALTYVDSYIGTTLTAPTTVTPFNYKPSTGFTTSAIVRTATAATTLGTSRGQTQTGSGSGGGGVGGSTTGKPTTILPGEKITLLLTNKGGAGNCVSIAVYFTEVI